MGRLLQHPKRESKQGNERCLADWIDVSTQVTVVSQLVFGGEGRGLKCEKGGHTENYNTGVPHLRYQLFSTMRKKVVNVGQHSFFSLSWAMV